LDDTAYAIAIDSSFVYITGEDRAVFGSDIWRIEKRDITTGALVSGFGVGGVVQSILPGALSDGIPYAIAIDSSFVYTTGYDDANLTSGVDRELRIEKREIDSGKAIFILAPEFAGPAGAI